MFLVFNVSHQFSFLVGNDRQLSIENSVYQYFSLRIDLCYWETSYCLSVVIFKDITNNMLKIETGILKWPSTARYIKIFLLKYGVGCARGHVLLRAVYVGSKAKKYIMVIDTDLSDNSISETMKDILI
jgi:hypothetical protein